VEVGPDQRLVVEQEARRRDLPRDHALGLLEEVAVVGPAAPTRPAEGGNERGLPLAAGPPRSLRVVRWRGRDVAQVDRGELANVDAELHSWRADEHVERVGVVLEGLLVALALVARELARVFLGQHRDPACERGGVLAAEEGGTVEPRAYIRLDAARAGTRGPEVVARPTLGAALATGRLERHPFDALGGKRPRAAPLPHVYLDQVADLRPAEQGREVADDPHGGVAVEGKRAKGPAHERAAPPREAPPAEPEVAQVVVVGEHHRLVTGPARLVELCDVGQEVDDLLLEALAAEERLVIEGARSSHDIEDAACQVVAEVRIGGRQLGDALPQLVVVGGVGEPIVGDAQPAAVLERGLDEPCVARSLEQRAECEVARVARLGLLSPLAVLRDGGARIGGHRSRRLHRVKRGPAGLVARGERVVRVPPKLMADARRSTRERGKSDVIDAVAIARAAIREGLDTLPVAQLAGPERDVRLLVDHRERLVAQRTALINDLRWGLHDLWPELEIPPRALTTTRWHDRVAGRLARAEQTAQVRIARDELRRIRELTRAIDALEAELAVLVAALAPRLLAERGCGVLIAAKLIGEIAGIGRFGSDAKLARLAGSAPIPASSGRTDRHRLDRGGNRQLNCALHRLAISKGRLDPDSAAYLARKQAEGKSRREALRCLKRHLARRIWRLLQPAATEHSAGSSTRPPTLSPAGITIHCNTPHGRLSLT
jgi:transposase